MDIIWNLLLQRGVSPAEIDLYKEVFIILIMLPVVTTIVGIARYVIGTRTLGMFTPVIITFLLYEFGRIGTEQDILRALKYGIIFFLIVLIASWLSYKLLKRVRMNYIPKLTLVTIGVIVALFLSFIVSGILGFTGPVFINKFTLVILAILVEPFASAFARKSFSYGVSSAIDTFILSAFCYIIISLTKVQEFAEANLLVIPVLIIVNIYLGRFTGLRLSEYLRFRNILFSDNKASDNDTTKQSN